MILRAETETGSVYLIDTELKTWKKERMPLAEGPMPLRSQSGVYVKIDEIVVGKSIAMLGKPLDKRATFRMIQTSYVVKLEKEEKNAS